MKRLLLTGLMLIMVMIATGCGNAQMSSKIMDEYSFGTQTFTLGSSNVTLYLPFEIGKQESPSQDITKTTVSKTISYAGMGTHILVFVTGTQITEGMSNDLTIVANDAVHKISLDPNVKNLKTNIEAVTIDNVEGRKLTLTYTLNGINLQVLQYIFVDKGVLWNVIYQYRTTDEEAIALADSIGGKITISK